MTTAFGELQFSVYGEMPGKMVDERADVKPDTAYGKSKAAAEEFARKYSPAIPITALRFGMIYGPGFEEGYFRFSICSKAAKWQSSGAGRTSSPLCT